MTFVQTFVQTSVRGALLRASLAWLIITPAVAAARIWWSAVAAAAVGVVGVALYVGAFVVLRRRYGRGR
jgi:hypothetical protein